MKNNLDNSQIEKINLNNISNYKNRNIKKYSKNLKTECFSPVSFLSYKNKITEMQKLNLLDKFKYDECYFELMQNYWLVDTYIARYGITSDEHPENTLPAIKEAVNKKYAVLISAVMLSDGEIVCYKDKTLAKLNTENGYISNTDLNTIKKLKVLKSNESVPTLIEALNVIKGQVPVIIEVHQESEISKMEENLLKIILEYINTYNCYSKIAVLSMNPYTLEWFYNHAPYITRILKSCNFHKIKTYANIKAKKLKKLKYYKKTHADFISYNSIDLPNKYIKKCKPVGVIAYNVTSNTEHIKLLKHVDNIIFSNFIPEI